jgi:hypothetical protein
MKCVFLEYKLHSVESSELFMNKLKIIDTNHEQMMIIDTSHEPK